MSKSPVLLAALLASGALACKTQDEVKPDSEAQPASAQAQTKAGASSKRGASKPPPEARRDSPPEAIATTALVVGAVAPALDDLPSSTGPWSRGDKVTALVFYRGHW